MGTVKRHRPYPAEYEEWIVLKDGSPVFLRPIKPSDGPLIIDLFNRLSPETIFFRFLTHLEKLQPEFLRHIVEIDYEAHFALAAADREGETEVLVGTCRFIAPEKTNHAELTIVLRDDWQRRGLGRIMAARVIGIAKSKGISYMEIALDSRNEGMKKLFASLGYLVRYEPSIVDIADRMEIYIGEVVI